jgi:ketosteroid isomerase-like protein
VDAQASLDSPAGVSEAFTAAINAGDLPAALRLYGQDAVMVAPDGHCARGPAIGELLAGLMSMQVEMETQIERVIEAGDIAVASEAWTMRLLSPDGTSGEQHGRSIVLFARSQEGWRFSIDAPWGL